MQTVRIGTLIALVVAALAIGGVYKVLPPTMGKTPSAAGHHSEEEGHAHGAAAVTMDDAKIAAAGIVLDTAGPAILRDALRVHGTLQPNLENLVQVTPRFAGVVRDVRRRVGDKVEKGDLLAVVESNQSLTSYELRSPIKGTIIDRGIALGEYASEQKAAFVVADLTTVWADFAVPRRDLRKAKVGDSILIDPEDGDDPVMTKVTYLSPVGATDTQSAMVRAVIENADGRFKPGLFVAGRLVLAEQQVGLAIKLTALQTVEGRTVVFVRSGDKLEARDVELGQRDAEQAEVLFGVLEGDVYASKNSFVVKAELAKSTAAHEH